MHHYEPQSWTFVKGALATVDREFGFIGRHLFHGIIEFHVVHHLFPYVSSIAHPQSISLKRNFTNSVPSSRIPFYYAEEATEAIKPVVGDLYRRDDRSFLGQLWTNFSKCKYVVPDETTPGALKWAEPTR